MRCFSCDKLSGEYKTDKTVCASCKDVLKIDIVLLLLERDPVYLSENTRNKKGRKPKLTATQQHDIKWAHKRGQSMASLADEYNMSKGSIHRIVHAD